MPCTGCHQFPTKKKFSGGFSGPSLVGAGSRLNPDWIFAYLMDPEEFKPFKPMPTFSGLLSEKEIKAVARYVANFE
jgi:mono/diheme cytochrome c family protein